MTLFLWGFKDLMTLFLWGSHPIFVGESPYFCGGVTLFLWGNTLTMTYKSISYGTRKLYKSNKLSKLLVLE